MIHQSAVSAPAPVTMLGNFTMDMDSHLSSIQFKLKVTGIVMIPEYLTLSESNSKCIATKIHFLALLFTAHVEMYSQAGTAAPKPARRQLTLSLCRVQSS